MARKTSQKRWSDEVTRNSAALDLEPGVFTWSDPDRIARSLKRSAERAAQPARARPISLPCLNRAGAGLPVVRRRVLERAKPALRKAFGREPGGRSPVSSP